MQLLKGNVRYLLTTAKRDRPGPPAKSGKPQTVIEYSLTGELLDPRASAAAASLKGTACRLERVRTANGDVIQPDSGSRLPRTLRDPLLNSARAPTGRAMAREFFRSLKQRGEVALLEVPTVARVRAPPPPQRKAAPRPGSREAAPVAEDPLARLRAQMAAQDDWDAGDEPVKPKSSRSRSKSKSKSKSASRSSSSARRRKTQRKARRKRSLARWIKRRDSERRKARKQSAGRRTRHKN